MAEKSAIHATIRVFASCRNSDISTISPAAFGVENAEAGVDGHLRGRDGIMRCASVDRVPTGTTRMASTLKAVGGASRAEQDKRADDN